MGKLGRDWWWENLDHDLVGRALLNKALIQLSADGWGCTSSLVVFGRGDPTLRSMGSMVRLISPSGFTPKETFPDSCCQSPLSL